MRLTPTERAAITRAVTAVFGPAAVPKLFGSRTDDTARGGDIDLFIANVTGSALDVQYQRLALLAQLHHELGEQHIDVVALLCHAFIPLRDLQPLRSAARPMVICATAIASALNRIKRCRLKLHHSTTALVTNDVNSKKSLRQQNEEGLRLLSPIEGNGPKSCV